ncbi:MAG: hypothetical protein QNJ46_35645, partial [Leptolyngbyaceae cyanobacterium MO_188.B28]|nr:hypothetical protein [Leptolyngbyaceae cyanobacterium MO_188.B28]
MFANFLRKEPTYLLLLIFVIPTLFIFLEVPRLLRVWRKRLRAAEIRRKSIVYLLGRYRFYFLQYGQVPPIKPGIVIAIILCVILSFSIISITAVRENGWPSWTGFGMDSDLNADIVDIDSKLEIRDVKIVV